MGKKNFSGGLNSLLAPSQKDEPPQETYESPKAPDVIQKKGRPKTNFKEIAKTSQEGTLPGETRATFIVNEHMLELVKAIAFWDRVAIKDVIHEAINMCLEKKGEAYLNHALSELKKKRKHE